MDKFRLFFSRLDLLELEQFNELCKYVTFDIYLPTKKLNDPEKVCLKIKLKQVIPIEIFSVLYRNISGKKEFVDVEFVGNPVPIEPEQLSAYILFFLELNNIHNVLIINLIKRQSLTISDSGLVVITYDSKSEFKEFHTIEPELLNFFDVNKIFISKFDYQFNDDYKEVEAFRKTREEQILTPLKTNLDEIELKRVQIHNQKIFNNKCKEPNVKLVDIVYTGENQYVNVSGEIFKITVDPLRNGTQKFVFYISDYEDSIAITLFAGVKKSLNSYAADVNLPTFYLKSFKKGD
jgi:DNA polymerase III alpha subunit (gram-positive type)